MTEDRETEEGVLVGGRSPSVAVAVVVGVAPVEVVSREERVEEANDGDNDDDDKGVILSPATTC